MYIPNMIHNKKYIIVLAKKEEGPGDPTHLRAEVEVVIGAAVTFVASHAGLALTQPVAGTLQAAGPCKGWGNGGQGWRGHTHTHDSQM